MFCHKCGVNTASARLVQKGEPKMRWSWMPGALIAIAIASQSSAQKLGSKRAAGSQP